MPICPICSAQGAEISTVSYLESALSLFLKPFGGLMNYSCHACGFGWTSPSVPPEKLEQFYATTYEQRRTKQNVSLPGVQDALPLEPRFAAQLMLVRMFKVFKPGQNVLDIGPGWGLSFKALSRVASGLRFFAFEPNVHCADYLTKTYGVRVFSNSFPVKKEENTTFVDGHEFDLILMSHVLEHYNGTDVISILENVRRVLSIQGGIIVCEVPHADLTRYENHRVPDSGHLSFFSKPSLRSAFEKAGFNVLFVETCGIDYLSWWTRVHSIATPADAKRGFLFRWLKSLWPRSIRLPSKLLAAIIAFREDDQERRFWRSAEFDYAGDRTSLRIVATPKA